MDKTIYYDVAITQAARLLGLLDRNINSKTYGCFDRNYWHYKITDFPCVRHQEAALTLSLLYKLNRKDNPYFRNSNILRWINASLKFWCSIQNKDGSFNEWYPNEKSFAVTAFSSYTASECLLTNKSIRGKSQIVASLRKSGNWLLKRSDFHATNQTSGAILLLYNLYKLTNERKYLKACRDKLSRLIKKQTPEGWWNEYNGADIGYHSLTIDYLSKLLKKFSDQRLKNAIDKGIEFLSHFIHPNFTFGGEYGSRNTEFMIPHGIELSAGHNKDAASIAHAIRNSLKDSSAIGPYSLDDRYLCCIAYTWLQAYLDAKDTLKTPQYRFNSNFTKNFLGARLLVISNNNFYLIINYAKGALFRFYPKNVSGFFHDSGMLAVDEKSNILTSSWIADNTTEIGPDSIMVKGRLLKLRDEPMTTLKSISLRAFAKTFGNSQTLSSMMKNALRKRLIISSRKSSAHFTRQLWIGKKSIKVVDTLASKHKLKDVFLGEKYSNLFIPSSRYFQLQELNNKPLEFTGINKKSFKVERTLVYNKNKIEAKVKVG